MLLSKRGFEGLFCRAETAVWRRGTGIQKENFWMPGGLCSLVKGPGEAMQVKFWHWWSQGHCPIFGRLQTCTAEGFLSENQPHSLQNPLLLQTASLQAHSLQLLLHWQLPHLPFEEKYLKLQINLRKKTHEVLGLYWNCFTCFCHTKKMGVPKRKRSVVLQLPGMLFVMQEVHNFKAY